MSDSVLGKRSRSSASPPTGQESGHPEGKASVQATSPATQATVTVTIEGQTGTIAGAVEDEDDDDDEVGPTPDVGGDGPENVSNKRRKKKAGKTVYPTPPGR